VRQRFWLWAVAVLKFVTVCRAPSFIIGINNPMLPCLPLLPIADAVVLFIF